MTDRPQLPTVSNGLALGRLAVALLGSLLCLALLVTVSIGILKSCSASLQPDEFTQKPVEPDSRPEP